MHFNVQLARAERQHESLLCVGLDPEPSKFPGAWQGDASRIHDFCAAIVDATKAKPNSTRSVRASVGPGADVSSMKV